MTAKSALPGRGRRASSTIFMLGSASIQTRFCRRRPRPRSPSPVRQSFKALAQGNPKERTAGGCRKANISLIGAETRATTNDGAGSVAYRPPRIALRLEKVDPCPDGFWPRETTSTDEKSTEMARIDRVVDYRRRLTGCLAYRVHAELKWLCWHASCPLVTCRHSRQGQVTSRPSN